MDLIIWAALGALFTMHVFMLRRFFQLADYVERIGEKQLHAERANLTTFYSHAMRLERIESVDIIRARFPKDTDGG